MPPRDKDDQIEIIDEGNHLDTKKMLPRCRIEIVMLSYKLG